jgi:hypothetical protein
MRSRTLECAELVFSSTRLYVNAYFQRVHAAIKSGKLSGIFVIRAGQSDEASKRLRVPLNEDPPNLDIVAADGVRDNSKTDIALPMAPLTAKVVYSEVAVSVGLQITRTGEYFSHTFGLPVGLDSWDQSTAECGLAVNKKTYSIHGLTDEVLKDFKLNGVIHTQDVCEANEKTIWSQFRDEAAPESIPTVRLKLGCGVHRTCSGMTKNSDLCPKLITGTLAFAIYERVPGRLEALIRIVGDEAAKQVVLVR